MAKLKCHKILNLLSIVSDTHFYATKNRRLSLGVKILGGTPTACIRTIRFNSWLCSQFCPLAKAQPGKQQVMAQGGGSLWSMWEIWNECSPGQPQPFTAGIWVFSLSLHLSAFPFPSDSLSNEMHFRRKCFQECYEEASYKETIQVWS